MSDTDSDNQTRNMEVDKLDFLNSFFSESVPDISPECPTDLFLSPEVNHAMGISNSDQTMSSAYSNSENNHARNGHSISNVAAISKFIGPSGGITGDNFGLETPSKLKSTVNLSSGNSSSSLATPEPSSGDSQFFISTPSSNFSCPPDSVQNSSKVFCPNDLLPAFSVNRMNQPASISHAQKDIDPSNIMVNINSDDQSHGSTIRPLIPVANFTFVQSTLKPSRSSYQDHPPNLVRVLPPAQLFPRSIPYLDQLDYCFDSQLSPAPGPGQVSSDDLNNNRAVEVKEAVEVTPRFFPSVKVAPSPSVAVLLQPRLDQNPQMQNLKPKNLRPLKPSLKVKTQESNSYPLKTTTCEQRVDTKDLPQLQSHHESANRTSSSISSSSSVDQSSRTKSIFKTDISLFYSNSARQVPHAVQLGQNTIPLAKKRKNSAEFWNVELFEDGTEDLFIEKPKRFRDRRKKKVVDEKVIKEGCDIELVEDGTKDLFVEKPNRFRDRQKKKIVDKIVSKEACDIELFEVGTGDLFTEEPNRFRDSQKKRVVDEKVIKTVPELPGLIKVPSDKSGLLKSIRIASPIVSSIANGEVNKSASLVQIVKLSKPKKNEEVKSMQVAKLRKFKGVCYKPRPDCASCVELRLQQKRIKDEDVEKNLGDAGGLSNLCEDCGTEICLNNKGDKEPSGDVDPVIDDINEEYLKEIPPNLNESEDENEVGKLVMDVEEVSEIASSKESEEEDTRMSSSTIVSPVCSPSMFPAVCWSCKSTKSLGSWHAHKWQHDKFLCSSCFNFYKEKNAESSRKKAILPRKKKSEQSNQSGTISKVASPSASEAFEMLTFPQYSPSLQDLPPGTYDFSAQVETDLASLSTQVETELDTIS